MRAKFLCLLAAAAVFLCASCGREYDTARFHEKTELLRQEALADWMRQELGDAPAGDAGHAVFFSVSDGNSPANVYHGTGASVDEAWENAVSNAQEALKKSGMEPKWVKSDVVYIAGEISAEDLKESLLYSEVGFLSYGASFDPAFETALLEQELNATSAYDYENGGIDLDALNTYLKKSGREKLEALPDDYILFRCAGWLCDEQDEVCRLSASGLDYGRRILEQIDGDTAKAMVLSAADFLARNVSKDGAVPAEFGTDGSAKGTTDTAGQAEAILALLHAYKLSPDEGLAETIGCMVQNLAGQAAYDSEGRAFFPDGEEITLKGCALAAAALAEYAETFGDTESLALCGNAGDALLSMQGQEAGVLSHVLDSSFKEKEQFRASGYDGAAVYGLCRLYGVTGGQDYLDMAMHIADRMAVSHYAQEQDAWAAYAMDALTEYVPGRAEYYAFALENAQKNLEAIRGQETTSPAGLQLLMAAFETYSRMAAYGGSAEGFHLPLLLESIETRAERQADGYLFPETSMYLAKPEAVEGAFMVREEKFGISAENICRNMEGYYLYCKNYDKILENSLLDSEEEGSE